MEIYGVTDAVTNLLFVRVPADPQSGQYVFDERTGMVTLSPADKKRRVIISSPYGAHLDRVENRADRRRRQALTRRK